MRHGDRIDIGAARIFIELIDRPKSNPANVVFAEADERPMQRTGVIAVDHMDLLLNSKVDLNSLSDWNSKASWPTDEPGANVSANEAMCWWGKI